MKSIVDQLEANALVFKNLFQSISEEAMTWRPHPEKWCALEIICHLYDEERDDFRFRTKWVLERPGEVPPPFNPLDWVDEHKYMQQDYTNMINEFIDERHASIFWLRSLKKPDWTHCFDHPKLGTLTAKYFLTNWLAHDYLHIRQITKLKFDYLKSRSGESLDYAGTW